VPGTGFERWYHEKAALLGQTFDEFMDGARDAIPLRRFGTPEDRARGAVYLASDDSGYVTGHLLEIAGGFAGYAFSLAETARDPNPQASAYFATSHEPVRWSGRSTKKVAPRSAGSSPTRPCIRRTSSRAM
jgi:hypothetical protein